MMYDRILFDLDGTLTDPKIGITKSVNYALKKFGIHVTDLDTLIPFIGPPLVDSFIEFYGFTQEQALKAVEYYREYFSVTGLFENGVYDGIENLLTELVRHERHLFVATSKPTVFAKRILDHFKLTSYFDSIVGSNLDGTCVKKGDVIQVVLKEVPLVERKRTVMVGDRLHDVCGAKASGIDSIGVAYGYGGAGELCQAGATHLVYTVAELQQFLLGE